MTMHRPCLFGMLLALAACSPVARRPASAPSVSPQATAPAPAPAVAIAPRPAPAASIAPVPPPRLAPAPAKPLAQRVPVPTRAATRPAERAAAPAAARAPTPVPAAGQSLAGHLTLDAGNGWTLAPDDLANSVVYFVPAAGAPRPRPGRFHVYTLDRDFRPGAIAIPLGSTIEFVNQDEVRHNVFSVTPGTAFDLGYQVQGQSASQPFAHAGVVLVSCRVHRSMQAEVLVVPSAYVARVGADGAFTLRGLPAGKGTLYAWNPRVGLQKQAVSVPSAGPISLRLQVTRRAVGTEIDLGTRR